MRIGRREFVLSSGAFGALLAGGCLSNRIGGRYPGWRPGELDIHFIHTGVGGEIEGQTLVIRSE